MLKKYGGVLRAVFNALPLIILFCSSAAAYTVPQKIPVQGRLTNASTGVVLSGEYNFTFRIYNASTSGTLLWDENQTLTVDGNGLWNALLGNNTALSLNFSEDTYLEVELNHDGNPLPRVQLGTTPYAEWTDTASNLSCTDCLGTTEIEDIYLLNTGDNATGDYMFNGSLKVENSTGSSMLFVNSSNGYVGIGTTSPDTKVDIEQDTDSILALEINNSNTGTSAIARLTVRNDVSGGNFQVLSSGYSISNWQNKLGITAGSSLEGVFISTSSIQFDDGAAVTKVLFNMSSGNVGIGTTSPSSVLHVKLANGISSDTNVLTIDTPGITSAGDELRILFADQGVSNYPLSYIGSSFQSDTTNSYLTFGTRLSNTVSEKVRIDASGNVGIGTTSPGELLEINGSSSDGLMIRVPEEVNNMGSLYFSTGTGENAHTNQIASIHGWITQADPSSLKGGLLFYTNNGDSCNPRMSISSAGNVGIGTFTQESRLQVTGGGLCVGSDANCNSDNNDEGVVYSSSTSMTQYDVAEKYPTRENLSEGDVLVLDPDNPVFVKRSDDPYDSLVLGVVSSNPGVLLGGFNGDQYRNEMQVSVALSGRVPVKVSGENGPIQVGDTLVTSHVSGHAMKASKTSKTLGIALEPFNGEEGTIMCFVNIGTWVSPKEFGQLKADNEALKQAVCEINPQAGFCEGT